MNRGARITSWLQLLWLLLATSLCFVEARWTVRPRRTTSTTSTTTTAQPDRHQHVHHWPPLIAPKAPAATSTPTPTPSSSPSAIPSLSSESIRLIETFDQRSPDGQHEYRFQLSNGDTRYERSFWMPVGKNWVLARRGFYSVPLPNSQYSTVFYRADHQGYHVDSHTLSGEQPLLPRTLELPVELAKRNSMSVLERNEEDALMVPMAPMGNATKTQTRTRTRTRNQSQSPTKAKAQSVVQIQNRQSEKLKQNKTKPSTVAKVDDILATEVATAAVDVDDDDIDVDNDDDDDDVTESQPLRTRM
ncbi:hypothetical protein ACLKA7_007151 [Drosophila subpalustris]